MGRREAKSIGFSGTFCLTPRQAEISASAMSPSRLEQEWASQIKESLQKGVSRGVLQASPQHDKSYFGPPHHVMVDNIMGAVRDINGADACTSVNRGEFRFGKIHALYQGLNLSRAQPGKILIFVFTPHSSSETSLLLLFCHYYCCFCYREEGNGLTVSYNNSRMVGSLV